MARKLFPSLEALGDSPGKYLYHYSTELYDSLKSLRAQATLSKKELDNLDKEYSKLLEIEPYTKNISAFIEPIPYDIIGKLFNNDHSVWVNGKELYEYKIPVSSLESNITYVLVETKEDTKLFDEEYDPGMTSKAFDEFIIKKQRTKILNGDMGRGRSNLIKAIKAYLGTTRDYFIAARKRKDADKTAKQYAATVPHLMLYPSTGIIEYESYRTITIGKKN